MAFSVRLFTCFFGFLLLILSAPVNHLSAQDGFVFGADLSYIHEMEDCGAAFNISGTPVDPYTALAARGCNLARIRLWHTPSWYDPLNSGHRYSDLPDVIVSIQRAHEAGMKVLLDFHLSDTWADAGHQVVPATWADIVGNTEVLADSLYQYIFKTLHQLDDANVLPEWVQIGNETNRDILLSQAQNDQGWSLTWPRNAILFNRAFQAVRDAEVQLGQPIHIAVHFANPADVEWLAQQFWNNQVRDFDAIGFSYYAAYHPVSIATVGNLVASLKSTYPGKEVMILETAYPWTTQYEDNAPNLINTGVPGYPISPAGQKQWLVDLTQTVIDHGGDGMVYWEPGWVSTGCSTQWATGSSWENCTFFDFNDALMEDGGVGWMSYPYDFPSSVPDVSALTFRAWYSDQHIVLELTDQYQALLPASLEVYNTAGGSEVKMKITDLTGIYELPPLLPGLYFVSLQTGTKTIGFQKIAVSQ